MKKIFLAMTVSGFVLASCDNKAPDSTKTTEAVNETKFEDTNIEKDVEFASKAAEGGMLEVQLGELAQRNGTSPKIKEFGQSMIKDHGAANEELAALALKKNIALPAKLGDKKLKDYNDLNAKKGNEFDRAYAEFMVKDHEEDIKAFKDEAENGKDADIKAWASGKIATLEHHLQMAQEAQAFVKK